MSRKNQRKNQNSRNRRGRSAGPGGFNLSGSPTRHGSELDRQVRRILQRRIPATAKTKQIFELFASCRTPTELGGKTALELVTLTLMSEFRWLEDSEVPGLVYLVLYEIVSGRKWKPRAGLSFLAYVINGLKFFIHSSYRDGIREIPFTVLATYFQNGGTTEQDQDRIGVLGMLDSQMESWS